MTYNTTNDVREGLGTVLQAIAEEAKYGVRPIDVLALQEQHPSGATTDGIVDLLNGIYDADIYAAAEITGEMTRGSPGLPGLIYNGATIQLLDQDVVGMVSTSAQARHTLRYHLHPVGYGPEADFYLYNSHYKAGTGPTDRERRNMEATEVRADLDALGDGVHAILAGDFAARVPEPGALELWVLAGIFVWTGVYRRK